MKENQILEEKKRSKRKIQEQKEKYWKVKDNRDRKGEEV